MDETNEDIIQVRDPKEMPYGQQLTLMRQSMESRSQEIRRMAKVLKFEESGANERLENIALEIDKNIRQALELVLLRSVESTEKEWEIKDEISELKRKIERLKDQC